MILVIAIVIKNKNKTNSHSWAGPRGHEDALLFNALPGRDPQAPLGQGLPRPPSPDPRVL